MNTLPVNGGAMPAAILTLNHLLDEATGEVNLSVLKGLARRRAMQDYGCLSPRALRSALREYMGMLPQMQCAWRELHGLPVEYVTVTAYGTERRGGRRSAF